MSEIARRRFLAANGILGAGMVVGPLLRSGSPAAAQDRPAMTVTEQTAATVPSSAQTLPKWPKQIADGDDTIVIYQPQVEKWEGNTLEARAAVAVESKASPQPTLGVIWLAAETDVDKDQSLVSLTNVRVPKANFPTAAEKADHYLQAIRSSLPTEPRLVSLDRLRGSLAIVQAQTGTRTVEVKNDVPRIYYSKTPAVLVLVDGKPALREVKGTKLLRVINTRSLILLDQSAGTSYLRLGQFWMAATDIEGAWSLAAKPPAGAQTALKEATDSKQVMLLDDSNPAVQALDNGVTPPVFVSTSPAELLLTDGDPEFAPIDGTQLIYVNNCAANIIVDPSSQDYYALISGRWFRTKSLADGPWDYVANDKLPADFAKIPETHPKGDVLAAVAGTSAAQESVIDNNIPQTAAVDRKTAKLSVAYDGAPQFQPIEGTSLSYAVNTATPVIKIDESSLYCVQDAVWFVGKSPSGPWSVAASVPSAIYTIPSSSPLYYVTHAYVYSATPEVVYVGYTPGYYGTVVTPAGVVVYGTGYRFAGYAGPSYWYPPPWTYGNGAGFAWGAFTGFAFGFAAGTAWGWGWGAWHRDVNIKISSNVYDHWSRNVVHSRIADHYRSVETAGSDRARAGASASQQGLSGASGSRANDLYAGRDGDVYRRGMNGWEKHESQGWRDEDLGDRRPEFNREQSSRLRGAEYDHARSVGGGLYGGSATMRR